MIYSKSFLHPHLTFFLMDMSDVLNTSMLRNGFFRYLSSVDPGSLFQQWTLIKTPYRMELFFNAIWWVWPLSHTEESDGALSFSNSVLIIQKWKKMFLRRHPLQWKLKCICIMNLSNCSKHFLFFTDFSVDPQKDQFYLVQQVRCKAMSSFLPSSKNVKVCVKLSRKSISNWSTYAFW